MMWNLPTTVEIDGKKYNITNRCDYRMVLDVICAINDNDLTDEQKIRTALYIFYEDISDCTNLEQAVKEMYKIIAYDEEDANNENKPRLMDWEHDFKIIAPQISKSLGYSVRDKKNYTHYYDFIGAYMEMGECLFSTVVSIRSKKAKGKPLDDSEKEFYRENKKMVDLPLNLTEEEREWLDSDW